MLFILIFNKILIIYILSHIIFLIFVQSRTMYSNKVLIPLNIILYDIIKFMYSIAGLVFSWTIETSSQ